MSEAKISKSTQFSKAIADSIGDMLSSQNYPRRSAFDPYEMTDCPKRLLYKRNGDQPEKNYPTNKDSIDETLRIEKWRHFLSRSEGIRIAESEFKVADSQTNLVSNINFIVEYKDELAVVKVMTIEEDTFEKIRKDGHALRKDVVGLTLEMWLSEIPKGLLIYEDCHKGFMALEISPLQQVITVVKNKCSLVADRSMSGMEIQRPYPKKDKECSLCEFENKCWGTN